MDESVSAQFTAAQFETLYAQYADDVLRMAYFYLADRHKAEDVCQDVSSSSTRTGTPSRRDARRLGCFA